MKTNYWKIAVAGLAAVCLSGAFAGAQDTAAQDKMFLMKAAAGSMAEIQASQLALKKSKNADVKAFAQKMIDDHTMLLANQKPFADQMGVQPPTKLMKPDMDEMARLKSMSGDKFDTEYITAMVGDHHKDLGEFMTERDTTANADLKTVVAQGTDVVKQHTMMIDQMAQAKGITTPPMPSATE
jgi:putative membrane protein